LTALTVRDDAPGDERGVVDLPPPPDQTLENLALAGRVYDIRRLPRETFTDADALAGAVIAAASLGRARVIEHFEAIGCDVDRSIVLNCAVQGDRLAVLLYLESQGVETGTPGTISIALHHDCARVLTHWLDHCVIKNSDELLYRVLHYDALFCFRVIERRAAMSPNGSFHSIIRHHAKGRIREYLEATGALPPADRGRPPALARPARPKYTFRTPSGHIDLGKTTIVFLLYRRILRFMLGLR
jgi:hypothetical protein